MPTSGVADGWSNSVTAPSDEGAVTGEPMTEGETHRPHPNNQLPGQRHPFPGAARPIASYN